MFKAKVVPYIKAAIVIDAPEGFYHAEYEYEYDECKWQALPDIYQRGIPDSVTGKAKVFLEESTDILVGAAEPAINEVFSGGCLDTEDEVAQDLDREIAETIEGYPVQIFATAAFKVYINPED